MSTFVCVNYVHFKGLRPIFFLLCKEPGRTGDRISTDGNLTLTFLKYLYVVVDNLDVAFDNLLTRYIYLSCSVPVCLSNSGRKTVFQT